MKNLILPPASFRTLYAFGNKQAIDLSLSENPLGCSLEVIRVMKEITQIDCFDYPDPDSNLIRVDLAQRFKLSLKNFFISNGSESLIQLLPRVLMSKGEEAIVPVLTFPMFEKSVALAGGIVIQSPMTSDFSIDLIDIKEKISKETKIIFLCNPNNPTGKLLAKKDILQLVKNTKAFVIVDEANIEFGGESVISEVANYDNLIVLRTFSKGFGLAGLRVGFCVANPQGVNLLQMIAQPFAVNKFAQKAVIAALNDQVFMNKTRKFMVKERCFLTRELKKMSFEVVDSEANNLLVKVTPLFLSSNDFVEKLADLNVSVVNGTAFPVLGNDFVRVSPRTRKINKKFIEVISNILNI